VAPLAAQQTIHANVDQRRMLARYEVYNPSFRLAHGLLHDAAATPAFDRFLRANTSVDTALTPVNLEFVPSLGPSPQPDKPLIFVFVVDSLRPDYLGSYNRAVRFTPRLDAFASESVVFRNAFTRFGGTGLSVPAIWAGSALVHKQYVQPFHPMNTLEKLLDVNGYRKVVGRDSIMGRLLDASPRLDELDAGVANMDYHLCGTLGRSRPSSPRPIRHPSSPTRCRRTCTCHACRRRWNQDPSTAASTRRTPPRSTPSTPASATSWMRSRRAASTTAA
jgi:hypothetical protein